MTGSARRPSVRLAVLGVLVASLGLTACGRKGPLEMPPGASATTPPTLTPGVTEPKGVDGSSFTPEGQQPVAAPPGPNRRFILDGLLN